VKSKIVLLITTLAAAIVAATVSAPVANATNCNWSGAKGAGFDRPPSLTTTYSVNINATKASHVNGNFRSSISVSNGIDAVQAGLISDGSGLQQYIEYDGTFLKKIDADKNTSYSVSVGYLGSGQWEISEGNDAWIEHVASGNTGLYMWTTDAQTGGACNTYNFKWTQVAPFDLSYFTPDVGGSPVGAPAMLPGTNTVFYTFDTA